MLVLAIAQDADTVRYRLYDDPACGAPFTGSGDALLRDKTFSGAKPAPGLATFPAGEQFAVPIRPSLQGDPVRLEVETTFEDRALQYWCACPTLPTGDMARMLVPVRSM